MLELIPTRGKNNFCVYLALTAILCAMVHRKSKSMTKNELNVVLYSFA